MYVYDAVFHGGEATSDPPPTSGTLGLCISIFEDIVTETF